MMTTSRADDSTALTFTVRGEAALDELATVLVAHCSGTPEGIARVLDEVMHTPLDDLAAALSAIAGAAERRHQDRRLTDDELQQIDPTGHADTNHATDAWVAVPLQSADHNKPRSVAR
jgi:hypothetical protein